MDRDALKEKVASLPTAPGVYLMRDDKGRVLYIGKAKSLKDRVSSYFHAGADLAPKIRAMVALVTDVEHIPAESEVDALLMEARLVKDIQPKYNTDLKDDKSRPLLAVSKGEDFARVLVTREMDQAKFSYFGPFASASDLRSAVRILQGVFKYRTCELEIREGDEKRRFYRPCILWNIKMCTAPCAAHISKEKYAEDIASFRKFLQGGRKELLAELATRMKEAATKLDFESAASYRNQIQAIRRLAERGTLADVYDGDLVPIDPRKSLGSLQEVLGLMAPPRTIEGMDIAHLQGDEAVGSLVSFVDGVPFKAGYRRFKIKGVEGIDDYAMMREVVRRRFTKLVEEEQVFPDVLLIDGGLGHRNAVLAEFQAQGIAPPFVVALAKHEGDHLFVTSTDEPLVPDRHATGFRLLQYVRDEAHRFAQHYHHLLRGKSHFGDRRKRKKRS